MEASSLVLVVSDDSALGEEAEFSFPSDVEVLVAEDATRAMEIMAERPPGVVVCAIRTGHEGGFSLARYMSQHADLRAIPIFMILERPQDEWLAGQAGAAACRAQPIETSELVRVTMDLLAGGVVVGDGAAA